jgi:predicted Zn-dependent protease
VAKARIRLHHSQSPESLMKSLGNSDEDDELGSYLRAITHIAMQQPAAAKQSLQALLSRAPESIAYRETLGQLLYQEGEYALSANLYREGLKRYPHNPLLSLSLAKALIAQKNYSAARIVLQDLLRFTPHSAAAYQQLAKLESDSGNQAAAHLAQAEHYQLLGEPHSALEQLKLAKRIANLDFYHASRIEAMSSELMESIEHEQELLK